MILPRKVSVIGAPLGLGGAKTGASLGPTAIRLAGLVPRLERLGLDVRDTGDVEALEQLFLGPDALPANPNAKWVEQITDHCREVRDRVRSELTDGRLPVVLGGDHAVACGTIAAVSDHFAARDERIGLIWFDAHGDMNTPETSPSGNIHGMPLATCLGDGPSALLQLAQNRPMLDVNRCVLVAVHELDQRERDKIREHGIRVYTMREVDMLGMQRVMEEAIELACDGTAGLHVSFDVDGCDESIAPGTGTIVPGGTNYREAHLVMENVADTGQLVSLEIVEVNPLLDVKNRTAELAVGLIESALGKLVL